MKKLIALALLVLVTVSFGAEWYVSATTGRKKGMGTREDPFKNLWKALENAAPMDVIYVAEGNYNGKLNCGWLEFDKPLSIVGGYSPDFTKRDIALYQTMLKPTNAMNATRPSMGTLTIQFKKSIPGAVTLIDGIVFDQGDANCYHDSKGKPEGLEYGMLLLPPAKNKSEYSSIDRCMLYASSTEGDFVIRNCVFVNGSNYAMNINHREGMVKVENNLFINTRMIAANVQGATAKLDAVKFEFAYNTVLFTWSRTEDLGDMGYGVRCNSRTISNIHNNILGLNVYSGFDNSKGSVKEKRLYLDNNAFFLNRLADATFTISPNICKLKVEDEAFEDIEDYEGVESCSGNIAIKDPTLFKDAIDASYLAGFLSVAYKEEVDYNENSAVNTFREAFGLNKQGKIKSSTTMFGNRYPVKNIMKLFGACPGYGAQAVK